MDSPFYGQNSVIVMLVEPYLNTYYKSYQNIVTFSAMPSGPISEMVVPMKTPRLSIFQDPGPFYSNPFNCTYALLRYPKNRVVGIKQTDYFMCTDDIPAIFSYLMSNDYKINIIPNHYGVSETKLSGNRKYICHFHYNK